MLFGIGEYDTTGPNQNTKLVMTLVEERRSARGHLVKQNTKGPPINSKRVPSHVQDLRRQVLCRAAERICLIFWLQEFG